MRGKILIIEDDPDIREVIRQLLSSENYSVDEAESGEQGLLKIDDDIDLVILDINLPGISGLRTCEMIRESSNVPILFLTARSQESDRLIGLLSGGDDYLPKPFSYAELLGRINALLRRYKVYRGKNEGEAADPLKDEYIFAGDLKANKRFNEVLKNERDCELTDIEYRMLMLLLTHPNKIFSAQMLYESIWNEQYFYTCSNTVMVHIRKLRTKIENDPKNPDIIKTVWGRGYRYEDHTKI